MRLEDLHPNTGVRGVLPDQIVTVINVQWFGSLALELTYKAPSGRVANELLYRHDENRLEVVEHGRPWRTAICSASFQRRHKRSSSLFLALDGPGDFLWAEDT